MGSLLRRRWSYALVPWAMLLSVLLTGCTAETPEPAFQGHVGYKSSDGQEVWLRFNGTQEIVSHTGERKLALVLQTSKDPTFATVGTYWLDADMLLVGTGGGCLQEVSNECIRTDVTFSAEGRLAPLLVGLPSAHPHLRGVDVTAPANDRGTWRLSEVMLPTEPGNRYNVTARFDNAVFATEIEWQQENGEKVRWKRMTGYALPPSSDVDSIASKGPRHPLLPDQGTLFPGDTELVAGLDVTHLEPFEALLSVSETAAAMAEEGCILEVRESVEPPAERTLAEDRTIAWFYYRLGQDGRASEAWFVALKEDILGRQTFEVQAGQTSADDATCEQKEPFAFSTDANEVQEVYHALKLQAVQGAPEFRMKFLLANDHKLRFEIAAVPPHVDLSAGSVGYQPYIVRVDATTGWIDRVVVHPSDATRLGWIAR